MSGKLQIESHRLALHPGMGKTRNTKSLYAIRYKYVDSPMVHGMCP